MPPKRKCLFQQKWLEEFPWVREHKFPTMATCISCNKDLDIGAMGVSALRAHESRGAHEKLPPPQQQRIEDIFSKKGTKSSGKFYVPVGLWCVVYLLIFF